MADSDPDKTHPDNKKFSGEGWSDLKDKKRHCTDCLCLLMLMACWFTMTIIGFMVCGVIEDERLVSGDPARLLHAIDYDGRICGLDPGVRNRPNAYYMSSSAVVCMKGCPSSTDYSRFICYDELQSQADNSTLRAWELVAKQQCLFQIDTIELVNRCFPQPIDQNETLAIASKYIGTDGVLLEYEGDTSELYLTSFLTAVWVLRGYIFGFGLGVAFALSFLYLYLLRIPGLLTLVIWSILLALLAFLLVAAFCLWDQANRWSDPADDAPDRTETEVNSMYAFSYIMMALSILYVCFLLVMRKRIQLAIGMVREAARALAAMPALLLLPIAQFVGLLLFIVPWTAYVMYIASSGDVTVHQSETNPDVRYRTFEYDKNTKYAFLYMLFCYFWTSEFIIALGQLAVAASFAGWYFNREKSMLMNSTVLWGVRTTGYYHSGTAAYGSLIIAIMKTIQAVLTYLQKKVRKSDNIMSKIAGYVLSCLKCCMWCLEKCMKFINKNGYIQTAIHGYSFCKACRAAFFLLLRNILRVIGVSLVGDFVLLIGKLLVPIGTTLLCYLAIAYGLPESEVPAVVAPLIFVFILSYFIACMFCEVFGMGITTIMHCFIADEEMFEPNKRFAENSLRTTWQQTVQGAASSKIAPEEKENTKIAL
jgi:hypothetical protein